jgi:hypothetical protein
MLLNGRSLEQLGLGGSKVCSILSLVMYPKHVHFASLTLMAKYWGPERWAPLNNGIIIAQKVLY